VAHNHYDDHDRDGKDRAGGDQQRQRTALALPVAFRTPRPVVVVVLTRPTMACHVGS
jgi:hypothetical protein